MRVYTALLISLPILLLISCAAPEDIATLQRRVEEDPESPTAHYELALAYLNRGIRWEGMQDVGVAVVISKKWTKMAEREFQKVVELDPTLPEPHYWLKVIYNSLGKFEEADNEAQIYAELVAQRKRQKR